MMARIPTRDLGPVGTSCRRIYDIDGQLVLVEIDDGHTDLIGPTCSRTEALSLARAVLVNASERHPLPMMLHNLALAVLAMAGPQTIPPPLPRHGTRAAPSSGEVPA